MTITSIGIDNDHFRYTAFGASWHRIKGDLALFGTTQFVMDVHVTVKFSDGRILVGTWKIRL